MTYLGLFVVVSIGLTMLAANNTGDVDTFTAMELIEILLEFVDNTQEPQLKRLIQYVCGLLNTSNPENGQLASKLIRKLFAVIVPNPKDDGQLQINNPELISDFLLCVQMWTSQFPKEDQLLLAELCSNSSNTGNKVLGQLFEDILRELGAKCITPSKLYCRIQKLLESKNNEKRYSGYLILQKLLDKTSSENLDLYSYISVMECLKSDQKSVPLSLLKEKNIDGNCTHIIYMRLLQNKNIPLLLTIIEFIMDHFTAAELFSANLLVEFLSATNCLELHNMEAHHIQESKMINFVAENDNKQFLKAFAEVAWTGVSLHRWLNSLDPKSQPLIKNTLLLKLAAHVRKIENINLRISVGNRFCDVFEVNELNVMYIKYSLSTNCISEHTRKFVSGPFYDIC